MKIIFYILGVCVVLLGFTESFKLWLYLKRRIQNEKVGRWLSPVIAGLVGGTATVFVFLLAFWLYNSFDFIHIFVNDMMNLF